MYVCDMHSRRHQSCMLHTDGRFICPDPSVTEVPPPQPTGALRNPWFEHMHAASHGAGRAHDRLDAIDRCSAGVGSHTANQRTEITGKNTDFHACVMSLVPPPGRRSQTCSQTRPAVGPQSIAPAAHGAGPVHAGRPRIAPRPPAASPPSCAPCARRPRSTKCDWSLLSRQP